MSYLENPRGHVVFDCDGTLISSQESIYEGLSELMTIILEREVTIDEARLKYAADLVTVANNFDLEPENDPELQHKLITTWREVASKQKHQFRLFPGIKDLILELTKKEYQLYVWTARDRQSTLRILKDLEVAQYFLEFRCLDDCEPKPSPVGLEQMVGDIPRDNIVMIGDSYPDLYGASSFGCKSIAACWAADDLDQYLAKYDPSALAKAPQDCLKLIEKLIG
jgi:phosphoglycolate phosphatase